MILELTTFGDSFQEKSQIMKRQSSLGRASVIFFHSVSGSPEVGGRVLSTLTSVISSLILRIMAEWSRLERAL